MEGEKRFGILITTNFKKEEGLKKAFLKIGLKFGLLSIIWNQGPEFQDSLNGGGELEEGVLEALFEFARENSNVILELKTKSDI